MDKDKIKIKLERHKWPDEVENEKRQKSKLWKTLLIVGISLAIGFTFGSVLSPQTVTEPNSNIARFERVYNRLLSNWYFKNDMEDPASQLIENAINGMIDYNGDIHTSYMTLEESEQFTSSIDMSFVGIGVEYFADENLITRVFKDSPAERAGILAGDIMIAADGVRFEGLDADEDIRELILGEVGTVVKITVNRLGEVITLDVVRDHINALTWGEMIDDTTGYVEISSFGQNLKAATELYLKDFKTQGAKKLIIDFRDNGGGYLDAINDLSELFFEAGTTVYFEQFTDGNEVEYRVRPHNGDIYTYDKIVILVNGNTASASEVFTLALQSNLGSVIVGDVTYGKGTVQTQVQDGVDSSFLKYTFAKWFSPDKTNIHQTGITPDHQVVLPDIFYEIYPVLEENESYGYDTVHNSIAYVQKGLSFLGYHTGRTDGYFDSNTRAAILNFKNDVELTTGDVIDHDTIASVYSAVIKEWSHNKKIHDVQYQKALEVIHN